MISATMIMEDGTEQKLVHYVHGGELTGEWLIACTPNMKAVASQPNRQFPYMRTNDFRAVTCPLCLKSEVVKKSLVGVGKVQAVVVH